MQRCSFKQEPCCKVLPDEKCRTMWSCHAPELKLMEPAIPLGELLHRLVRLLAIPIIGQASGKIKSEGDAVETALSTCVRSNFPSLSCFKV